MRELYPQRQAVLIAALARASGGALRLAASEHGLHLLHELAPGQPDSELSARAAEAGVALSPLSRYTIESPRCGWLFGYAGFETAALRAAARVVGNLVRAG
jgi:GntR family transcriptional regulator/MocR family aminotransferase